jgi:hypothetical protein
MTTQKMSIILNTPPDGDEWIEVVNGTGPRRKVWEYTDPSKDLVPTLPELEPPRPKHVNQEISACGQHSPDEKEEYRILRQDYKRPLDLCHWHENALSSLRTYIQSPAHRTLPLLHIWNHRPVKSSPNFRNGFNRQISFKN